METYPFGRCWTRHRTISVLSKWLTDECVLEFYEGRDNPYNLKKVREKFGPRARGKDRVIPCILSYENRAIGYIQYYPLTATEVRAYGVETIEPVYGLDLFIGEIDGWDRGIGTRVVSALVHYLFDTVGAWRVVIDPRTSNHRAIRCYEKCGFRKIKLLPKRVFTRESSFSPDMNYMKGTTGTAGSWQLIARSPRTWPMQVAK